MQRAHRTTQGPSQSGIQSVNHACMHGAENHRVEEVEWSGGNGGSFFKVSKRPATHTYIHALRFLSSAEPATNNLTVSQSASEDC